jgi:hypothetical protein
MEKSGHPLIESNHYQSDGYSKLCTTADGSPALAYVFKDNAAALDCYR